MHYESVKHHCQYTPHKNIPQVHCIALYEEITFSHTITEMEAFNFFSNITLKWQNIKRN